MYKVVMLWHTVRSLLSMSLTQSHSLTQLGIVHTENNLWNGEKPQYLEMRES